MDDRLDNVINADGKLINPMKHDEVSKLRQKIF
jgi:hypothetical protein